MDASIIASYYRHIQLQYAIDRDEAEEKDIYKVNQLQTKIAWNEVSAEVIKRCWFRTKVVSPHDKNGVPIVLLITDEGIDDMEENLFFDPNNELAVKELQQQINILHVCNPMPIEDLLNLEEEQEIHYQFTNKDLIHTATEIEQEQLNILHSALRIVDERIDDGGVTMKSLRKLQFCIREEVQKEKA
ncbi:20251_t:CDS:2, partial [Racocetra persica]